MASENSRLGQNRYDNATIESVVQPLIDAAISGVVVVTDIGGTAGVPGLPIHGVANAGLYNDGGHLGISAGGSNVMDFSSSAITSVKPLRGSDGTAAAPEYGFTSSTNDGMYLDAAHQIGFSSSGVKRAHINDTELYTTKRFKTDDTTQASSTSTGSGIFAGGLGVAKNAYIGDTLYLGSGGQSFITDTGTGYYSVGVGDFGIATSGVLRFDVSTSNVTSKLPYRAPLGDATAPTYAFTGDTASGLFQPLAGNVAIATAGVQRFNVGQTELDCSVPVWVSDGTVLAPSVAFGSNNDMGLYRIGNNHWGLATAGANTLDFTTSAITPAVPIAYPAGTAGAPSITFSGDLDTGFSHPAANQLALNTGGTSRVTLDSTSVTSTLPFYAPAGTAAAPSLTFSGDSNTGLHNIGADQIGIDTNGTLRMSVDTTSVTSTLPFYASSGTAGAPGWSFSGDSDTGVHNSAANTLALDTGGTTRMTLSSTSLTNTLPLLGANGTVSAPAYSFSANTGTGMYQGGSNLLDFATAGVKRVELSGSALTSTINFWGVNGSAANPSYNFTNAASNDIGMYLISEGNLGFSTVGTQRLSILGSTSVTSTLPFLAPNGTVSLPALAFSGDTNTGIYNIGADNVGVACGGAKVMDLSGTRIQSNVNHHFADGAAATPSLSFVSDTNTGHYWIGADNFGTTCGGSKIQDFSGTRIQSNVNHHFADGAAATPSASFVSDTDTGMFHGGTNTTSFASGGTNMMDIGSTVIQGYEPFMLPNYQTVNLPTMSAGQTGAMAFDTTVNRPKWWTGAVWQPFSFV